MNINEDIIFYILLVILLILIIAQIIISISMYKDKIRFKPKLGGGVYLSRENFTKFNKRDNKKTLPLINLLSYDKYVPLFEKSIKLRNQPAIFKLDDIDESIKYVESESIYTPTYHIGQRKLFLCELKASIDIKIIYNEITPIIIYAGSSPCNKLYLLLEMFPDYKFVLVDPNETHIFIDHGKTPDERISHYQKDTNNIIYFRSLLANMYNVNSEKFITYLGDNGPTRINRNEYTQDKHTDINKAIEFIQNSDYRIFIIEDFMTCELAEQLSVLPNIHFWCDIRTSSNVKHKSEIEGSNVGVSDIDIIWNLAQQYNWVVRLKPKSYMLKFRCPFNDINDESLDLLLEEPYKKDIELASELNLINNYKKGTLKYLDGVVEIQQFPGRTSTESRLKGDKFNLVDYKFTEYEDKFSYYNKISRWLVHRENKAVNKITRGFGFCHCNDCAQEAVIWQLYNDNIKDIDITQKIIELCKITGRNLFSNGHGNFVEPYTKDKYNNLFEKYKNNYRP